MQYITVYSKGKKQTLLGYIRQAAENHEEKIHYRKKTQGLVRCNKRKGVWMVTENNRL